MWKGLGHSKAESAWECHTARHSIQITLDHPSVMAMPVTRQPRGIPAGPGSGVIFSVSFVYPLPFLQASGARQR